MEMDYNLKTSGERFQILCLYLTKIIENLLWFALLAKIHLISPSWCPGAFCVSVKAFNLNFSEVLTKREQNHRDNAPLISSWSNYMEISRTIPLGEGTCYLVEG